MDDLTPNPHPRNRLPLWIGLIVLILLFPAIVIPLLVGAFREPAFQSLDDVEVAQIARLELFLLNRPDGGPDVGGTRGLFPVPEADHAAVLNLLRQSSRVDAVTPRGIWMGRIVFTLKNGRTQTVMLHRPPTDYTATGQRLELRVGPLQFDGPPVKEFVLRMAALAGQEPVKD